MIYIDKAQGRILPRLALIGALLLLPLYACDTGDLLEVEDPDIVTPGSLQGETGRAAVFAGAVGDFALGYDGGAGGGSFLDAFVTTTAYMSDEAYLAGTFPTRTEFDQRSVDDRNGTLQGVFARLQRARRATENGAAVLSEAAASDERAAELLALAGFTYVALGEAFCSGVPFSTATLGGELEFGGPQTTQQIFERAVERFNSAGAANLARIGLGRALLNLGRYADAAAAVASVPSDFLYTLTHSVASGRQENGFFAANSSTNRLGIANDEGGAGPPYDTSAAGSGNGLEFLSANDPRIPFSVVNRAFDSTVPQTNVLDAYGGFGIPLSKTADSPLASGIEARLIEAEAALQAGEDGRSLQILNTLRSESSLNLAPLAGAGSESARVDQLFRERAFWLYATGHRLGDLRRLIRQYGRSANMVFPSGSYFKGGSYGNDVNLPIPQEERNNPEFTECLDRNA